MEKRIHETFFSFGHRVPIVWIDVFDREALTHDFITHCIATPHLKALQRRLSDLHRENHLGEDSATLKHLFAAYTLLRNPQWRNAIIIEDDATFVPHVMQTETWLQPQGVFQSILRDLPSDYDIVMLSRFDHTDTTTTHLPRVGRHLVLAQSSRVSSAYLISRKGASNMLRSLPVIAPPDFQINYAAMKEDQARTAEFPVPISSYHNVQIFHSLPWISDQMDPIGTTATTIRNWNAIADDIAQAVKLRDEGKGV
jgi:hypothetical protein